MSQATGNVSSDQIVKNYHWFTFQSDIIEVFVGANPKPFRVHREQICAKSPFFKKCLENNMGEALTKVVNLPEDEPIAFVGVLSWVYHEEIPRLRAIRDIKFWVQFYLPADKFCMERLANKIMDEVKSWHENNYPQLFLLSDIPAVPLKQFLIDQLAWELRCNSIWDNAIMAKDLIEFFSKGGDIVVEVLTKSVDMRTKEASDPSRGPDCTYHKHLDSLKCSLQIDGGPRDKGSQSEFKKSLKPQLHV
jgi:hypothetical protein